MARYLMLAAAMLSAAPCVWAQSWRELGGSGTGGGVSATDGPSAFPSMAVDAAGNPAVAWVDGSSGLAQIYFRRWDGTAWIELGGSANGGGVSASAGFCIFPSLALDPAGHPVIAWVESMEICLRRWDGTAWVELGGSATGGGISRTAGSSVYPSLAVDAGGNPAVAWAEDSAIYLRRWDGMRWTAVDGSDGLVHWSFLGDATLPCLRLDTAGRPAIAWQHNFGGNLVYFKRWDGSSWIELAGSATLEGVTAPAYGSALRPSLALDAYGNPAIAYAWLLPSGQYQVHYLQWYGAGWAALGGSASDGGVSGAIGASCEEVSLVRDRTGRPAIAWQEYDPATQTYTLSLKRWTGVAWEEAGLAGVSQAAGPRPALAITGDDRLAVAWQGPSWAASEILYLEQFVPPPPPRQGRDDGDRGRDAACHGAVAGGAGALPLVLLAVLCAVAARRPVI